MNEAKPPHILIAEDDDEDYELCRRAFELARLVNPVHRVRDGQELLDFLLRRGVYGRPRNLPSPLLILLDLRMPRKDGLQALAEIKERPGLRRIPVIVLTTSAEEADVLRCYDLGSNSYIKKPAGIEELLQVVRALKQYWLEVVALPEARAAKA